MSFFFLRLLLARIFAPKNKRLMAMAKTYRGKFKYEINGEKFKVKYKYTIIDPKQSSEVCYVEHPAFSSHKFLLIKSRYNSSFFVFKSLFNLWLDRGNCPIIVCVTFGKVFFLTDQHPDDKPKDEDATIDTYSMVRAKIAEKHGLLTGKLHNIIIGISMGALNAFNYVARKPDVVKKLVLLSPMTPDNPDPWDKDDENFKSAILIKSNFTPDSWAKHNPHNPQGPRFDARNPPVHVQYSTEDEWDLASGGKKLGEKLNAVNLKSELFLNYGGHGQFDPITILKFLDRGEEE